MNKFRFDIKICKTCKFFDGDVDDSAQKLQMYYCSKILEYIDAEGQLQRYTTMKITQEIRDEWKSGFDRRVLLCPFHLEHTLSFEEKKVLKIP